MSQFVDLVGEQDEAALAKVIEERRRRADSDV
jgi:hypothetical protein